MRTVGELREWLNILPDDLEIEILHDTILTRDTATCLDGARYEGHFNFEDDDEGNQAKDLDNTSIILPRGVVFPCRWRDMVAAG